MPFDEHSKGIILKLVPSRASFFSPIRLISTPYRSKYIMKSCLRVWAKRVVTPADTSGRSGSVAEVVEVDSKLPAAADSIVANP